MIDKYLCLFLLIILFSCESKEKYENDCLIDSVFTNKDVVVQYDTCSFEYQMKDSSGFLLRKGIYREGVFTGNDYWYYNNGNIKSINPVHKDRLGGGIKYTFYENDSGLVFSERLEFLNFGDRIYHRITEFDKN